MTTKEWINKTWKERQITNEEFTVGELKAFLQATQGTYQMDVPGIVIARAAVKNSVEEHEKYLQELRAGEYDELSQEITEKWKQNGKFIELAEEANEND